jgi:serine/threonine-protein kinase PknK
MAGERMDGTSAPAPKGIAEELTSAGFVNALEIGRGGFGVVYHCYQPSLARSVAVKVLDSNIEPINGERFLREGYAMGRLSGHPNVMHVLQVGVTPSDRLYIVMPYFSADSLSQRLRRTGPIPWPEALQIGVKLCGALETAHRTDTLHRDIKPANVLVNDYGEPVLSDFGLARISGGFKTGTGNFTGTVSYTAPEVLTGGPPTVAADIYSLGATLYALLAGSAAHVRKSGEDLIAHYQRVSSRSVPDLRPAGIPASVCTPIERSMSLDPSKRQASAEEFGEELQAAQRETGLAPVSMALTIVSGETRPYSLRAVSQPSLSETTSSLSETTSSLADRTADGTSDRTSETTSMCETTAITDTTAIIDRSAVTPGGPSRGTPTPVPDPSLAEAPTQLRPRSDLTPPADPVAPTQVRPLSEISPPGGAGAPTVPARGRVPPGKAGGAGAPQAPQVPPGPQAPQVPPGPQAPQVPTGGWVPPGPQVPPGPSSGWVPPGPQGQMWSEPLTKKPNSALMLWAAVAVVMALLVVAGIVFLLT